MLFIGGVLSKNKDKRGIIMSYKKYDYKNFSCKLPNGKIVMFICHTENTRYGFRHLCHDTDSGITEKCCYYNRTWERFEYESVLKKSIENLPDSIRGVVYATLIDGTADRIKAECDKFLSAFKAEYDKLSPSMKNALSKTNIQNEKQAKMTLAVMKMSNLINGK